MTSVHAIMGIQQLYGSCRANLEPTMGATQAPNKLRTVRVVYRPMLNTIACTQ